MDLKYWKGCLNDEVDSAQPVIFTTVGILAVYNGKFKFPSLDLLNRTDL